MLLKELSFQEGLNMIRSNSLPKMLRFEASEARCQFDQHDSDVSKIDYIETFFEGTSKSTLKQYVAVLSKDGGPPTCDAAEVAVALPNDSCSTLHGEFSGKHILIPTLSGCTPYQKAIFAQYAGAKSVIFVQHDGMKPVQIVVPAYSTQAPTAGLVLKIPLVMIAGESGSEIVNLLGQLNPSADSLRLRLVLSSKCLAPEYSHLYANNFAARSIEEETREALAGYITFHIAKTQGSFEFVRLDAGNNELSVLPLGTIAAYFPSPQDQQDICQCAQEPPHCLLKLQKDKAYLQQHMVVLVPSQNTCTVVELLFLLSSLKVKGIIYGEDNNDLLDPPAILHALCSQRGQSSEQYSISHSRVESQSAVDLSSVLLISGRSVRTIRSMGKDLSSLGPIFLDLYPENALHHLWNDLALLLEPANWPLCGTTRKKLFRRILKDYTFLDANKQHNGISPDQGNNERREILLALYEKAENFHNQKAAFTQQVFEGLAVTKTARRSSCQVY
ncbi:hypothetical protein ABG067_001091 [Albugo candida]